MHDTSSKKTVADAIIHWQQHAGRHHLPWQNTRDPYRVWLSEIMLQQTTVSTVIPYYKRFLAQFPTIEKLAAAPLDQVLACWAGLGYYSRARHLHRAAQQVVSNGTFPQTSEEIARLPGIGPSTAAAIAVFCFQESTPILDGNVKRIFARLSGQEEPIDSTQGTRLLWDMAKALMPDHHQAIYIQGLMDLGATCCKRTQPHCEGCPIQSQCYAYQQGRTADFPKKTPKKPKPTKANHIALILSANRLLLCQHQPTLWQNLWVPPMGPADAPYDMAFPTHRPEHYERLTKEVPQSLWTEKHSFTHFHYHMQITLWLIPDHYPDLYHNSGWSWIPIDQPDAYGCPAPVQRWMRRLHTHQKRAQSAHTIPLFETL